ncbi:MAG TPA: D-2-hydroxyacid dehydrogenase [Candidatus Sulfotelmatobacter sp.]|jgi:phosphoglycerate dehydrogenase-like enzyme|nr:D-2-hydroxyacid dehydrogenase [Candidatus Sulfotelmatobacter sp.]
MKLLIVVHSQFELWNAPKWFGERLAQEFPQLQVTQRGSYDGIETELCEAEVLFSSSLRPEQFAVARQLRWIHAPSAAVHDLLFPELAKSEVVLTNSREVHGPVVAEHVMALIFALAKKIPQAALLQQRRIWGKGEMWNQRTRPREIAGATLGLIGVGSIGGRVAKLAAAMGMRVIAVREHVEKGSPDGGEAVFAPSQIDDVLRQSDFVVLAAPLVTSTERVMDAGRLDNMKPSGYLINVGRGAQVDEAALIEALRSHRIAGAALDVFDQEPLPPDSPLWGLEDLLITPHTAGLTEKLWQRHYQLFSENLRRYLAGQPLWFVVDKQKGY